MRDNLIAGLCAFALSFLLSKLLIPILRRFKAGQTVLSYVKEHREKSGTPTMGGLAFILSASIVALLFGERTRILSVAAVIGLAYLLVGFLDDFIKIRLSRNEGLKPYQKILFQLAIAIFVGIFCLRNGITEVYFPFLPFALDFGIWFVPLALFVFLATVNCVNLTDGLDGLAASVSAMYFLCLGVIIVKEGESSDLATLSFCLVGALLAYLVFNTSKASVFMGDTGSLALGGLAAATALLSGNVLYIPLLGICFVLSGISVLVQVIYYKATHGKRVFLMAPLHHHFQEKGYTESKITYCYAIVTLLVGLCCILGVR